MDKGTKIFLIGLLALALYTVCWCTLAFVLVLMFANGG